MFAMRPDEPEVRLYGRAPCEDGDGQRQRRDCPRR